MNKKKKIIILISIITIITIIGVIVGANAIKVTILNREYDSANNSSNSKNLIPEYIKEGITLGGITGSLIDLDTSDANATAEDIIWGKTAYVKGEKITGTKIVTVEQGKISQKTFIKNTVLTDDYGNMVKVPAGFKISEDSATAVTGGVVIEDVTAGDNNTKGSQFVWVPVGNIITDNNGSKTTITLGRYALSTTGSATLMQTAENYASEIGIQQDGTGNYYIEQLNSTSSINAKAKDIGNFIRKSLSSGGFYIGRYEAGDGYAITSPRTENTSDSNPVVSKAGVYPYNYVTELQASSISQNMYSNNNFESDLINSYAWDTAIMVIRAFEDSNYSTQLPLQTTLVKCGESHSGEKYDQRFKIFDMAGSMREWNTESSIDPNYPGTTRGGSYALNAQVCRRYGYAIPPITTSYIEAYDVGFRVVLYL